MISFPFASKQYNKSILTVAVCLLCIIGYSQTATLSGKVTAENSPLPFANIYIKGTSLGASTDVNGQFIIRDIPFGEYTLVISSIGFEVLSEYISLTKPVNIISNFQLIENAASLDEVVISGTMKEVSKLDSPIPVSYTHLTLPTKA